VWSDDDVIALLDSLLRSYHVGTIITWEQRDLPETTGMFGRVNLPLRATRAELVLDGQQRLGAIASAFLSPHFACDLREGRFVAGGEPRPGRMPLTLLADVCGLLEWVGAHPTPEDHQDFRLAARISDRLLRAKIPVIRLPEEWSVEQAVEMFRRLNSTGVRMSAADLEGILRAYTSATAPSTP